MFTVLTFFFSTPHSTPFIFHPLLFHYCNFVFTLKVFMDDICMFNMDENIVCYEGELLDLNGPKVSLKIRVPRFVCTLVTRNCT